ncbi:hypothetical protein [Deinococcus sonorensis]|uniref:DUF4139 domain-containing protein n=2 Tax=Deinococcus sonorensis TaxID=309891 RepID=A0AAU7UDS5_9DEIO
MRRPLLALSLLLAGTAAAQTTGPAVPALPPAQTATSPAVSSLLLTAAPGTLAEYRLQSSTAISVVDFHAEAQPGQTVSAATLQKLNLELLAQKASLEKTLSAAQQTPAPSKTFMRVLPVAGGSGLLTTSVVQMPAVAGRPASTVSISVRQQMDASGRVVDLQVSSSDPQVQQVYQGLDMKSLLSAQQGSGMYGLALTPGVPARSRVTFPVQNLLGGMFAIIGAQSGLDLQNRVQADPLLYTSVTTLQGDDAQGNHLLSQDSSGEPWALEVHLDHIQMTLRVVDMTGHSQLAYRPDGLPLSQNARQRYEVEMQMNEPGEAYRMIMRMRYDVTTQLHLVSVQL